MTPKEAAKIVAENRKKLALFNVEAEKVLHELERAAHVLTQHFAQYFVSKKPGGKDNSGGADARPNPIDRKG